MSKRNHKRPGRTPFYSKASQFLSSLRLTLSVILILVAVCLIGVFLMQAPSEVTADPASYSSWVANVATPKYGAWTGFLSALRFFDVFHSPWFLAVGTLLMVNILFCTAKRWTAVLNSVRGGNLQQATAFFRTGTERAESKLKVKPSQAGQAVTDALKERHYRVRTENYDGTVNLAARKNRFSPAGTFITHLSLILFILGFLVTAFWGFNQKTFIVAEGSKADVGHGTGLSLALTSFEDEYWPSGAPKDFRSDVVLYSGNQTVAQGLVRVNSPLSYHGINFYQASFGPASRLQVRASEQVLFDSVLPLTGTTVNEGVARYFAELDLQGGITAILLSPSFNGPDPAISDNEVGLLIYRQGTDLPVASDVIQPGVPRDLENLEFTFIGQAQYSVFQVTRSPGILIVWITCGALVLGLGLVFYLPYRQLWVLIEPVKHEDSHLTIRGVGRSSPGMNEINALLKQVHGRLCQ
jgi:cytochrome c biogenesis protein